MNDELREKLEKLVIRGSEIGDIAAAILQIDTKLIEREAVLKKMIAANDLRHWEEKNAPIGGI